MYHEPMFLERPEFEKVAVTIKLPDDEKKWAPKILSELHRQVPVMDQFHANIILDRLEPNKGYGFGYIIAQPKVLNPLMSAGLPKIKIPVVVKNWHLSPLDVFYDPEGRGFPLSERRVREALLRPDTFDVAPKASKGEYGADIRNMMQPPWENVGQFYRGVNTQVSSGQVKTSSLLKSLNGTVEDKDLKKLASWVSSTEGRASLHGDQEIKDTFLEALRLGRQGSIVKTSSKHGAPVRQYRWDGGAEVIVKEATPGGFEPIMYKIAAEQAPQQVPQQQQQQLAQEGQATEASEDSVLTPAELEVDAFTQISSFGLYKVITTSNEQLTGWVFPYTVAYNMQKVPVQIFTDGTNFSMGQQIAGVLQGTGTSLPSEAPQGRGMFYMHRNGKAFGLAPVELMGQQQTEDGSVMYMAKTLLGGNDIQLQVVQSLQIPTQMDETLYGIPSDVKWLSFKQPINPLVGDAAQASQRAGAYYNMRLQQAQQQAAQQQQAQQQGGKEGGQTKKAGLLGLYGGATLGEDLHYNLGVNRLWGRPDRVQTTKYVDKKGREVTQSGKPINTQAKTASLAVKVRMTQDGTFTLTGAPFEKVAAAHTHFLDYADAEWMLALAGVDPDYTRVKLANLNRQGGLTEINVFRCVEPPSVTVEKVAARREIAQHLGGFMAKHAAAIGDPMIADSLLSLNFLSSKNLNMFMAYLPQLNSSVNALVNLVVASRVGLNEIPESACKDAMESIEKVIAGIKMLMMREASL